jgi:acyl-CoA thioesterase-1
MKNKWIIVLILSCVSFSSSTNKLPKVLIIGDSISGGYLPVVKEKLQGIAEVQTPKEPGDGGGTNNAILYIDKWIGEKKWHVIHFNFGLHDIKHIDPETGKNSKNLNHPQQANPEQYGKNLSEIVKKLKATNAKLIFATTTPYPDKLGKQMRSPGMPKIYNQVALEIMKKNGIEVNDLYSFVLPRMDELQRPNNVHFTEAGSKALGTQVAKAIDNNL